MNLDDIKTYKEFDPEDSYKLITELPDQCLKAWADVTALVLPPYYLNVHKVVIAGMGGSGIGGKLARDLTASSSEIPVSIHGNYGTPAFVDEKTLFIAVSYSGNTEEVTDAFVEAYKAGARLVAITSGGELARLADKYSVPCYKFDYVSPPRSALGYLFVSVLALLKKLNIADVGTQELELAVTMMRGVLERNSRERTTTDNQAKQIATKLHGKIPIIYGTNLTENVAFRWKTQINENAKTPAYAETIPESNHNSLVGLEFPDNLSANLSVVVLSAKSDHPKSKIRQQFFIKTLQARKIDAQLIGLSPKTSSTLAEVCGLIYLGDLTSYYLAMTNGIDPSPIKVITKLKETLGK
jgi:glucose/mannose-6-phosphate isomerase